MSSGPLFAFDHKLSWDGLLTLLGGFLALLGIWVQVRHADEGLRKQLQAEKDARTAERDERKRAVAAALLFEIDRFYRFYIAGLLKVATSVSPIPELESPGTSPFPAYAGNCGHVGELDETLAAAIADFYASAQRHAFRVCDYAERRNGPNSNQILGLLPGVRSGAESLVPLAYIACAYLCVYTGTSFTAAQFETAKHEYMNEVTLQAAHDAVRAYRTKLKR